MARSQSLVAALKRQLKIQGISYRQLGTLLNLSESAIKQMFAGGNMSLKRLDSICEALRLDVSDLVRLTDEHDKRLDVLSIEQETELISDPVLLLVAYCVVNHWKFDEIIGKYAISETECVRYLARLDRMKLLELLPGNRIKPLITVNFQWQPDGPIERYFRTEVQDQFFNSRFTEDDALRLVKLGDLTTKSVHQIIDRLVGFGQLFDDLNREERKQPFDQRYGTTMVLAIRHWEFAAFQQLERKAE